MTRQHEARYAEGIDGTPACAVCGFPIMEAIYTGGWMHQERQPHTFAAFVYADGSRHATLCTACTQGPEAAIHQPEPERCDTCGHPVDAHDVRGWNAESTCASDCESCRSTFPTSTEGTPAMKSKPELPQALHVALLNCQVAHDQRSRAHTRYLDAEFGHRAARTVTALHQEWRQAEQQADAAFRDLGRALDAEGGHALWRIVYLKGGRKRSTIQVRPTRESARRREGVARLALRRRLEAQGAVVQYLVAVPVRMKRDVDGWDRTQGLTFLGRESFAQRPSLGAWEVLAYGILPPAPEPSDRCRGGHASQYDHDHDLAGTDPRCLAKYADGFDFACTLPQGHDGQHQDDVTDAPATIAWYDTQAPWNIARQVPPEVAYARSITYLGRCPACQAQVGNYHADTCGREGIVGALDADAAPRQDRPRASRTAQDGRKAPDLTEWAPGEVTEAYGR